MSIKYEYVTGEIVQINVPDNVGKVSIEIERNILNSNRKETRRHNSIQAMEEQGLQLEAGEDISELVEAKEINKDLYAALNQLQPQQKELIQKIFFRNMSITQIARDEGVGKSAIKNRLNKIYKKISNYLEI